MSPFPHDSTDIWLAIGVGDGRGGVYCRSEPVFVKVYEAPEIDSEESILQAYVAWQADTTKGVDVPARQAENRFLGSLKGLQMRALYYVTLSICLYLEIELIIKYLLSPRKHHRKGERT